MNDESIDDAMDSIDPAGDLADIGGPIVDFHNSHQADAVGKPVNRQFLEPQSPGLFQLVQHFALDRVRDGSLMLFPFPARRIVQGRNGIVHGRQFPVVA